MKEAFSDLKLSFTSLVISAMAGGFVFMVLWEWFIVPPFHVAPLTLMQSIGVDDIRKTFAAYEG